MLSGLSKRYLGQDYTNKKALSGNITVEMIDGVCLQSHAFNWEEVIVKYSRMFCGVHCESDCVFSFNFSLQLSKTSFPLCMQQLHQAFRQNHHLRHWGRMQYGLFLKGIGLSLDEALRFWRTEFLKKMDPDKVIIYPIRIVYVSTSFRYNQLVMYYLVEHCFNIFCFSLTSHILIPFDIIMVKKESVPTTHRTAV